MLNEHDRAYLDQLILSFENHLASVLGDTPLQDLSPDEIQSFILKQDAGQKLAELNSLVRSLIESYSTNVSKVVGLSAALKEEFLKYITELYNKVERLPSASPVFEELRENLSVLRAEIKNHTHDYFKKHDKEYNHHDIAKNTTARHSQEHTFSEHLPVTRDELKKIVKGDEIIFRSTLPKEKSLVNLPVTKHGIQHVAGDDRIPIASDSTAGLMSNSMVLFLKRIKKDIDRLYNMKAKQVILTSKADGGGGSGTASSYTLEFVDADLTAGELVVTHGLDSKYVNVTLYDENDKVIIPDDITATDKNTSTIDLSSVGTLTGTWNVVII